MFHGCTYLHIALQVHLFQGIMKLLICLTRNSIYCNNSNYKHIQYLRLCLISYRVNHSVVDVLVKFPLYWYLKSRSTISCMLLYCCSEFRSQRFFIIRARSICSRWTTAYRLIVRPLSPPPMILDVPTSAASHLHVYKTREILAAKGRTVGENVGW
jgi:hypothetical protein